MSKDTKLKQSTKKSNSVKAFDSNVALTIKLRVPMLVQCRSDIKDKTVLYVNAHVSRFLKILLKGNPNSFEAVFGKLSKAFKCLKPWVLGCCELL